MKLKKKDLVKLYTSLVRARAFDEAFIKRLASGKLLGFYHPSEGGEGPGVGACAFLRDDDFLYPHIRGHGLPHMIAKGIDPKYFMAEHSGKSTGQSRGVSTFHCIDTAHGLYGVGGTLGSGFPVSVGWGLAAQKNGTGQVVMCCFGDGTSGRGNMHESLLFAANWKLPIIYLCENNGLSIYTRIEDAHPMEDVASLAQGYGIPGVVVDGQDVIAVADAVNAAVDRARKGKGPSMVECKTNRCTTHSIGLPDMVDDQPRTDECIADLRSRDPIDICREKLLKQKVLTKKDVERITKEAVDEVAEAEKFTEESPVPDPAMFDELLYAD